MVQAMVKDRIEPLETENSLKKLERYRLLVDSIKDYAIFLMDKDGYVVTWNVGAERFKGYKPQEIIGRHFSVFYPEKDKHHKPDLELRIAKQYGRVEDEGWRIRNDGSRFWANVVITALHDETGNLIGFAKVTRDLTERKDYADKLAEANVKLRVTQKELKKLNAAKDEFILLASHQLRTPATGVKQFISLLLEGFAGKLTSKQTYFLQKAFEGNDRQIELVNDLLRVAQVDAGHLILEKMPTAIGRLVKDVVDEQMDHFKKRRQQISVNVQPRLPKISLDPVRFRMVLENLIDNASKYTPESGKIEVSVSANKKEVHVRVSDNGVGFSESERKKMFQKFSRIPNQLSRSVGGSGLGLYWAKKVAELHGGSIMLERNISKGSVFTAVVPNK